MNVNKDKKSFEEDSQLILTIVNFDVFEILISFAIYRIVLMGIS